MVNKNYINCDCPKADLHQNISLNQKTRPIFYIPVDFSVSTILSWKDK